MSDQKEGGGGEDPHSPLVVVEETKVAYAKCSTSIQTPDVAAHATEYAIRDLLHTPEFKKEIK